MGYKVAYYNMNKLFTLLRMSKADNSYLKLLESMAKKDLLILDDFGIQPFDAATCLMLLEIIEDRHGKKSTIIASQVPVKKWHELLVEHTVHFGHAGPPISVMLTHPQRERNLVIQS